ncbi:MAG: hypothetical protein ACE148_07490 [Vicinamibacterales bacterium]
MKSRAIFLAAALAVVALAAGCNRDDGEPAFAAPEFLANRTRIPLGSPVEVTYKFTVQPAAQQLSGDYRVFVHFLDDNEELMWTDDHQPPEPVKAWRPGQQVQYSRTIFVPVYPYIGEASVHMGLYDASGNRVKLAGNDRGSRAYEVARVELLPQSENVFLIYRDGWHQPEVSGDNAAIEWQWTKKEASLQFRNPKRDIVFYLHVGEQRGLPGPAQVVDVYAGAQKVDSFPVDASRDIIRKIPVAATLLGTAETAEIRLAVDRTFVPALLPAAASTDSRELGIRVFHAFVEVR